MNENLTIFLLVALAVSAVYDLRVQRIPNWITLPGMLVAVTLHSFSNGVSGFLFSTGGLVLGIGLLLIPHIMGGLGAGDAKLFGTVGSVLGPKGVFYAFIFTAIVGGLYAILLIFIHRRQYRGFITEQINLLKVFLITRKFEPFEKKPDSNRPKLCYAIAISIGTGIYIGLDRAGSQILFY